jgi:huntingtin
VPTAIPALQPIVHDLFVLRGTNKADAGKELETQKEVVVSMLLRLIQYHQVRGKSMTSTRTVPDTSLAL